MTCSLWLLDKHLFSWCFRIATSHIAGKDINWLLLLRFFKASFCLLSNITVINIHSFIRKLYCLDNRSQLAWVIFLVFVSCRPILIHLFSIKVNIRQKLAFYIFTCLLILVKWWFSTFTRLIFYSWFFILTISFGRIACIKKLLSLDLFVIFAKFRFHNAWAESHLLNIVWTIWI